MKSKQLRLQKSQNTQVLFVVRYFPTIRLVCQLPSTRGSARFLSVVLVKSSPIEKSERAWKNLQSSATTQILTVRYIPNFGWYIRMENIQQYSKPSYS